MKEESLIISLTNHKAFPLNTLQTNPNRDKVKKDTKPNNGMVYDKFFLIFGNSELRLRHAENKVYSNFGVANGYFLSKGDNVNTLLTEGKTNEA